MDDQPAEQQPDGWPERITNASSVLCLASLGTACIAPLPIMGWLCLAGGVIGIGGPLTALAIRQCEADPAPDLDLLPLEDVPDYEMPEHEPPHAARPKPRQPWTQKVHTRHGKRAAHHR